MSRVPIHNFSISLDGFATGEGQALETPFGHAGHRLHEWLFALGARSTLELRAPTCIWTSALDRFPDARV